MSYERLNDEESRARVAAIIAAAESLANDEVRPVKSTSPTGNVSYRKWAIGLGLAACTLAALVIWRQSTREVVADQTQPPSVLVAGDLVATTVTPSTVDPALTTTVVETTVATTAPVDTTPGVTVPVATVAPGDTTTVVATTAPVATTTAPATTAPATTAPATTAPVTTAPATTAPPTVTTIPVEGPHLVTDPAIEAFTALSGPIATAAGRVPDQATADRIIQRINEFLRVDTVENFLQVDPAAQRPIPLFVMLSDTVWNGDSATVQLTFGPQVVQMANALKARPASTISIYAHTDNHGPAAELNAQTLAQAQSLKDILVAQGVTPDNIQIFGKGATQPVATEETPDGKQVNRRVELVVSGLFD